MVDADSEALAIAVQACEEGPAVGVVGEDGFAIVAAVEEMVTDGERAALAAGLARHTSVLLAGMAGSAGGRGSALLGGLSFSGPF
jgi:hypothetical protein